jgi:hypothetical protein
MPNTFKLSRVVTLLSVIAPVALALAYLYA